MFLLLSIEVMSQYDDHKINDKWVEVKRAVPQNQMPPGHAYLPATETLQGDEIPLLSVPTIRIT
eukprot:342313-Amphidinium_carterae.1